MAGTQTKKGNEMKNANENTKAEIAETREYQNVTIFIVSEFFGVKSVFCKVLSVCYKKYAQYPRATYLRFRKSRQRRDRGTVLFYDQTMVIVEGKAANFDNFALVRETLDGVQVSEGRHTACSPEWADDLKAHAASAGRVLFAQNKKGEEISL